MQEGHTETCCEHTPRPVPQPLAHWQRYRYQWCCLESGVTSRKSSRVALLLKRDGPCDIHLIHDSLIKQPVFTPRRRELTSQKKVLPTLALLAIDTHTPTHTHSLNRLDPEAGNTQVLSSTCAAGWASSLTPAVQLSHRLGEVSLGRDG